MNKTIKSALAVLAGATLVAGCTSTGPASNIDAEFAAMMQESFRDQGIAKTDRLKQDLAQAACSSPKAPPADVAKRIETENLATVKWPAGGQYFGDWKVGEKLAQSGRGATWIDKAGTAGNGGQCYNCHQITKQEISFGTIGPSLYNYGKIRGVKNVADPASAEIVKYTWGKLYNAKAYNACSNMPRFGHMGLLDETQMRHLMSLLLDPASPVNN